MSAYEQAAQIAKARQFPCAQCGAQLTYKPGSTVLQCGYCGFTNEIPQTAREAGELDYRAQLAALADVEPVLDRTALKCQSCRAQVQPAAHQTALDCPFCGANLIALDDAQRLIRPRLLLPFKVPRDVAWETYRRWITSRWFAPTKLKRFARAQGRLQGLYCPYWTYDAATTSTYRGQRGDHYYVTVGQGEKRQRQRRTRWTPVSGTVRNTFDDLLVNASTSLPRTHAARLEPWDLENLTDYADEYLSGFAAESYQVGLEQGFEIANQWIRDAIIRSVRADIGGDVQQVQDLQTAYDRITFKHILLPVWMNAYSHRGKVYRFLINGRTGEVQGERPWSGVKIALAVLAGLAAVAVLLVVALATQ